MQVKYTGTNPAFVALVEDINAGPGIVRAVSTGRFRSADKANRLKWRLTATWLDYNCSQYSYTCRQRHLRMLLATLKRNPNIPLDEIDLEGYR
jgi:hypothetical protein